MWAAWLTRLPTQCRWMATSPRPHRVNTTAGPPSPPPLRSTTQHCPRHNTDTPGGSGKGTPATTHAYQDNSDVGLRGLPPAGRPQPAPVPLPLPCLPAMRGGDPRGARGAAAGRGGGAGRAAGWAAPGSLRRHQAVDAGTCAGRGDRPRRPGCKPRCPAPGGGPRRTGGWDRSPSKPLRGPDCGSRRAVGAGCGPGAGPRRLAGSRRSRRGGRGGCTRSRDRGHGESRRCPGRPRRGPQHAAGAGNGPRAGPDRLAGAAAAAAEGREGAKYRAHANPSHTQTSPPKPYPPKAAFPTGRTRHIRPPAPERTPPGVTLRQLRRQQDARRVIREGGDSAQARQGAGHGRAERGTGGDRGSAQGQTQGAGPGARGKERGQKVGVGIFGSSGCLL